jgi:hypothetical protein
MDGSIPSVVGGVAALDRASQLAKSGSETVRKVYHDAVALQRPAGSTQAFGGGRKLIMSAWLAITAALPVGRLRRWSAVTSVRAVSDPARMHLPAPQGLVPAG